MQPSEPLLRLAIQAQTDRDAIPVLGDLIIETGWTHPFVMPLCLGVPLDPTPPSVHATPAARARWQEKRDASLRYATANWDLYAGHRGDWARADLAAMLFGHWSGPHRRRFGSTCPWPVVRANATEPSRALARIQRAHYAELRAESAARRGIRTIAQQFNGE